MKNSVISVFILLSSLSVCLGQTILFDSTATQLTDYTIKKEKKIQEGSVFTKIIAREIPATILYEDDTVIAFLPLKLQAKVHILIVPKKEIYTINDLTEEDAIIIGKLFLVAKKLAQQQGIAQTGYRLALNTNQDAGQAVFHLHLHLLGGENLGAMTSKEE